MAIMLLDRNRLIVSVDGYTFCLSPLTSELIWKNSAPVAPCGLRATVCKKKLRSIF